MGVFDFLKKQKAEPELSPDKFGENDDFFPPPPGGGPMPEPSISPALKQQMGVPPQLPPPNMNPNQFGSASQFGAPSIQPPQAVPQLPPPQAVPQLPPPNMPNMNIPSIDNSIPEPPMPPMNEIKPIAQEEPKDHVTLMTDDIEQIVETVIDEKFEKIAAKINNLDGLKKDMDTQIQNMTKSVDSMQKRLDETQKSIMNKVSEYNKSIMNVDSEIKALTQVFSKIMPTFTSNVKELSKAVGRVKKKPSTTSSTSKRRPKKK
jgi:prefoldin subunit 5